MINTLSIVKNSLVKSAKFVPIEHLKTPELITNKQIEYHVYQAYEWVGIEGPARDGLSNQKRSNKAKNSPICYSKSVLKESLDVKRVIQTGIF